MGREALLPEEVITPGTFDEGFHRGEGIAGTKRCDEIIYRLSLMYYLCK